VVLFPRLALTTGWAEHDRLDPTDAARARRVQICVGRALAGFLLARPGG
jgi:hypothetical protein